MNPLIVPNDQMTEHPMSRVRCSSLLGNMYTTMELARHISQTHGNDEIERATYNPEGTVNAAKIPCNARRAKKDLRSCTVWERKSRMSTIGHKHPSPLNEERRTHQSYSPTSTRSFPQIPQNMTTAPATCHTPFLPAEYTPQMP